MKQTIGGRDSRIGMHKMKEVTMKSTKSVPYPTSKSEEKWDSIFEAQGYSMAWF
jgi:hypothetical protein